MKKNLLLALIITCSLPCFAQGMKILIQGDLKVLKGEKKLNTTFTYDNMTIGDNILTEAAYIKRKKGDYNDEEPGRGEQWEKAWFNDRKDRFEPKFILLFEKYCNLSTKGEGKYALIFKTKRTEPGWNVGVMRRPALIDAEAWIIETANPTNVVAKIKMKNVPGQDGMGYDFDTGFRIQEAYAKSGKEIAKIITKELK
jgi:hypothetical protein